MRAGILLWRMGLVLALACAPLVQAIELLIPPIRTWEASELAVAHQNWSVMQHSSGLIYVGNGNRVLEFDGVTWRQIETPNKSRVRSLVEGHDGRVYVGAIDDFGVLVPDAVGRLQYQSLSASQTPDFGEIWRVLRVDASIYFMARSALFRYRAEQDVQRIESRSSFRNIFAYEGKLLVSEQDQVPSWLSPEDGQRTPLPCAEAFGRTAIGAATTIAAGLLLFNGDKGAMLYNGQCLQPWGEASHDLLRASWPYGAVTTAQAEVALGSIRGGLLIFDQAGALQRQLRQSDGLLSDTVLGIGTDQDGGLWLAQEGGVARIDWASGVSVLRDAQARSLSALARYRGALYAGTPLGIFVLRPGAQQSTASAEPIDASLSNVNALLAHASGLLIAARGGIFLWHDGQMQSLLQAELGYSLTQAREDPLRLHAGLAPGYARLNFTPAGWVQEEYRADITDTIQSVAEGVAGEVWLGTEVGRFYRLTWPEKGMPAQVERFDAAHGVPPGNAMPFDIDGSNGDDVAFATTQGVMRLASSRDRFELDPRFAAAMQGEDVSAFRLQAAPHGMIYARVAGDTGWFEPGADQTLQWRHSALAALPRSSVLNFLIEPEGVWFARDRDLAFRKHAVATVPPKKFPLLLRSLSHAEQTLYAGAGDLQWAARPADAHRWRAEFAWPHFAEPMQLQYRSRIVGDEPSDWQGWASATTRDFERLPGGHYQLEVQARNGQGQTSDIARWPFSVTPPWHTTPLARFVFLLLGVLLLAALTTLLAYWRTRRLRAANLQLEQVIAERTEELRAQAAKLSAQDTAKSVFFANVSHEFRTPLTLILGPLDDLRQGRFGELQRLVGEQINTAARNARRLLGLINQILDLNRLEAGHLELRLRQADLAEFLRLSSEPFVALAERRNIQFVREGIDACVGFTFDPDQLDKVVQNLLSNAFKFTASGGRIVLQLLVRDHDVLIKVQDTGIGIAPEDIAHVFERYYQSRDSNQLLQPGTGIGLALVKELVELHRGSISVVSEPKRGSCFTVVLPGIEATGAALVLSTALQDFKSAPVEIEISRSLEPQEDAAAEDERTTILIVDDNAELREFVAQRLRDTYRVLEAEDGEVGLTLIRRELPDLIVCDVMMPKCDGFSLLDQLRHDATIDHLPIVMLTSRSTPQDLIAGLRKGADDYLVKPFDSSELRVRIERLIALRHRLRERFGQPPAAIATPAKATAIAATTMPSSDDADPFVQRVREVARARMADSAFGVQALADAVHLDRTQLYRRLMQSIGKTPLQFLRELRLERAAELLRQRAGNVSEIAYGVGFESLSHFSRCYREHYGHTPSQSIQ